MAPKTLLVHIPAGPAPNIGNIFLMPVGILALADLLSRNGYPARVLHLGVERLSRPDFDLESYLEQEKIDVLCADLHWHYQSRAVMNTIKEIKGKAGDIITVLGGFTASFFAEEIMGQHPEVDFVIKGDGEVPLLDLLGQISSGGEDLSDIPNLVWRKDGKVISNSHTYKVSQEVIDSLTYSNFDLLEHAKIYTRLVNPLQNYLEQPCQQLNCYSCEEECSGIFYYNCGRGCPTRCSFCGGSIDAQRIINNRTEPIFISHRRVISELKALGRYNISGWYTCFDPYPQGDYYPELFRRIRQEGIRLNCWFECWGLPTRKFIDDFAATFGPESEAILSVESGSERVRAKNKGFQFTNDELLEALAYQHSKGLRKHIYFAVGLPFEGEEELKETFDLINRLKITYGEDIDIEVSMISYEPGSPIFLDNEKYGVTPKGNSFEDFCDCGTLEKIIGYRTELFSEEEIIEKTRLIRSAVICPRVEEMEMDFRRFADFDYCPVCPYLDECSMGQEKEYFPFM
ncbi:MAG TPA: radical SAM protein [Candidatus Latescibacteria bacterium]|nr:radical SAM protein [Candidatus Latescibacterota bacterium]